MSRFSHAGLEQYCSQVLEKFGVRSDVGLYVAKGLSQASLRGVDSHGIRLLPHYINGLEAGRLNPDPTFRFEETSASTGTLDGDNTFGHATGAQGMGHAIELARKSGMGAVAVSNSSHFGAAAYFSLMAPEKVMIGISFTHADALILSPGGTRPFFGTNPICFAAPCLDEEPFCLDMATTTVTWNKLLRSAEEGQSVPIGWGVDQDGNDIQDPSNVRALHSIGGYKGFGLGMMVDVLCGLLTGMPFGRDISRMYADPIEEKRSLGHFFMALRIDRFVPADEFKARMQGMMDALREEPQMDVDVPIQVAGDPEKQATQDRLKHGIPLSDSEAESLRNLGRRYEIEFPAVMPGVAAE